MFKVFKTNNGLLALMFFEVFLLPMWNFGPIPFKFSLLIILYSLLRKLPKFYFIAPIFGLIFLLWLGKFYSYLFLDEYQFQQTIRATVNYSLITAAFLYSQKVKNIDNFNWIAILALAFGFINIFIFIIGPNFPPIISFYSLGDRLDDGLFFYRNPGINTNPNGSALIGNLILLFWVVSKKNDLITLKSPFWNLIVFVSIGLAMISFVSKSGFIAYFILCLYYVINNFSIRNLFYTSFAIIIAMFFVLNFTKKLNPQELIVFEQGIDKILNMDDAIASELNKNNSFDGSRIFKIKAALDDFIFSPLFGNGSDRFTGSKLSETAYHNDWSEILVSTGILGILAFIIVVYRVSKLNYILILPFFIPGMTNAFMFTMQIVAFYFLFVGLIYKSKTKLNFQ